MTAEPEATIKQSLTVEATSEDDSYVEPIDDWADYKEWRLQEDIAEWNQLMGGK